MGATRDRLIELLKRRGEASARELSREVGVTPPAARQHLVAMQRDGLVSVRVVKRPVGRPVGLYRLTPAAEPHFATAYGPLALGLLRASSRSRGPREVARLLSAWREGLLRAYRKRLRGRNRVEDLRELARIRDAEGYECEVAGDMLVEHHCPIAAVAREFPEVCRQEQLLFEAALGRKLRRIEHLVSGGERCRYAPAGAVVPRRRRARRRAAPRRAARRRRRR
ncbi:MAG: ArsR family transcriptional regulator [Planctomycetales bacterium]|nr:ArsR family transcriptional regulator [Planctomycetales bacterium]